ncbi:TetR/AcrR family transcriptional regulator [Denitrobaculum tricleocarpae]|uniref:TetR/AcrR family transcriptional regulator n=1 Tax=Denitrobaculum tricleocarpae TaxID=2591009 RepID=A0A545TR75_9PROT|nr:TetR/AcrR family transcriptional regulator [Denitrobaculum tricleocarpae]TQV79716.1 TetR/AcrR family transcriptional regulator [Denitrobaculum tricleocarpae]
MTEKLFKPGSPPDRILKAARRLYFSEGVDKVSTDTLAREASVSKTTMYKYFPDQSELFRLVVEAEGDRFETGVPTDVESPEALRTILIQYGTQLLSFLNERDIIQFGQLIHEEARDHPTVARTFYDAAYGRTHARLTDLLRQGLEADHIRSTLTAEELSEQLIGMWESLSYVRAQLCLTKKPYPKPKDWSRKCVDTLMGASTTLRTSP